MTSGLPLLAMKRRKDSRKESVDKEYTSSKYTALYIEHYPGIALSPFLINKGPAKSIPIISKIVASFTRSVGSGTGSDFSDFALYRWHLIHFFTLLRTASLPLCIQNFSRRILKRIWVPAWQFVIWKCSISHFVEILLSGKRIGDKKYGASSIRSVILVCSLMMPSSALNVLK